jgi:hypothetical protein
VREFYKYQLPITVTTTVSRRIPRSEALRKFQAAYHSTLKIWRSGGYCAYVPNGVFDTVVTIDC